MSSRAFRKEEVEGKTVIETSGKVGGKVKDITFSLDGTITLIVVKDDGSETKVPLRQVVGISDHVVVRTDGVGMPVPAAAAVPMRGVCKYCGAEVPPGNSWCPACGRAQT